MALSESQITCVNTSIYTTCVLVISWPIYILLIHKWYSHRNHFVICNRWPIISLFIFAASVITQFLILLRGIFCVVALTHICVGITTASSGLIYYRSYLLYAQTMKTRAYLNTMAPSKHMIIQKDHTSCYQNCPWSKFILCTVITASITVTVTRFYREMEPIMRYGTRFSFTVISLIGIICVINIVRNKIADSIGITKECLFNIFINFAMLIITLFSKPICPAVIDINLWLGLLVPVFYGFITFFIPYNIIRKATPRSERMRSPSTAKSTTPHHATGLTVPTTRSSENNVSISISQLPPLSDTHTLSRWIQKPLSIFLNNHFENQMLFARYLSECFALENILFLERAIILHHIIRKYQIGNDDGHDLDNSCYNVKFTFMTQIYADIEQMINYNTIEKQNEDNQGLMQKRGIVEVMKCIYREFCCIGCDTEINVGHDIRNELCELFENMDDEQRLKHFANYDDLLMVFHDAIVECWNMCEAIYGFHFKSYLKDTVFKGKIPTIGPDLEKTDSLVENDSLQKPKIEQINEKKKKDIVSVEVDFTRQMYD